jgi:sporulation protein YqfC
MREGKMKRKKILKENKARLENQIVSSLNLPKDIVMGAVMITLTGQSEAYIENYKGILEYDVSFIKLQTKTCKVLIEGSHLFIEYFTNDEMKVTGHIRQVKYL